MNNPFEFFGLDTDATQKALDVRYNDLKKELQEKRFEPGEAGEDAAKKLGMIDVLYSDACAAIKARDAADNGQDELLEIENLIKNNNLDAAQQKLDEVSSRSAEWHYLQSIIYYKQNWFLESKKQLEFCMSMEPSNAKYRTSYEKLTKIMASKTVAPEDLRSKEESTQGQPVNTGIPTCTGNCCCDMCLANSCCNCMSSCMHC